MLKRFFSKDDSKSDAKVEANELNTLVLQPVPKPAGSVKKIAQEVIEEVEIPV